MGVVVEQAGGEGDASAAGAGARSVPQTSGRGRVSCSDGRINQDGTLTVMTSPIAYDVTIFIPFA